MFAAILRRLSLAAAGLSLAPATPAQAQAFESPAPIAYMVDLSSGAILFSRQADRRIPPASMAKMMTTHVVFDLVERGELRLERMCQVRPETWQRWHGPQAGSTMFLSPGQRVSVGNLLHGIITLSGNDATVVLAECVSGTEAGFVALMNRQSRALGLANSRWGNPVGWPDQGRTYTTARDLAALAAATIRRHPRLYRDYYGRREFTWGRTMDSGDPITQPNRNPLFGRIAGADGLKTGHTEEAGFSFTGSAERGGRRLVMVVAGLTGFNQRIEESVRFMQWGFDAWRAHRLLAPGQRAGQARVQLGNSSLVGLVSPQGVAVTVPVGWTGRMSAHIVYRGPVRAPVSAGQPVARLEIRGAGLPPQATELMAEQAVGEAGILARVWAGLKHLFGLE
ncbi:MAG: D-alanyl-D-alanine carboxypeptidase family protein [Sphingosinicella sp.]